jgi:hypothetical protein
MSNYNYEDIRQELFSEEGVELLMQVRDHSGKLLFQAGAYTFEKVMRTVNGDTWLKMAALDYMVERKEIRQVYDPSNTMNRVYTKGEAA